jgi:DtxR family Mn-dependent transcriptional regulator
MGGMHRFGESEEMYLKTIAELGGASELVPITGISDKLGISTVSASEMVHRMQERGWVTHTPYKGVQLTESGARRANGVIRRHRLWERFLVDELNLPWDQAHEYACGLEHATDEALTNALGSYLGNPLTCPHGNPIPDPAGMVKEMPGKPLSKLAAGESGTIVRIADVSSALLGHLDGKRIDPGNELEVREVAPFNGPLTICINDHEVVIGREVAAHIFVDVR